MRRFLILAYFASCAWPQVIYDPLGGPPALREFLELTNAQMSSISAINLRFSLYRASRSARQVVLQFEINQETARETMDPAALGLRYREVELIRREIETERGKVRDEIQTVLTTTQKSKLATLQQALALQPAACDAVNQNLLALPPKRGEFTFSSPGLLNGYGSPCATSNIIPTSRIPIFTPQATRPIPESGAGDGPLQH